VRRICRVGESRSESFTDDNRSDRTRDEQDRDSIVNRWEKFLKGGDLRSIGNANRILQEVKTVSHFDELFECFFSSDRRVVMRAADAIEKITRDRHTWLQKHKRQIIKLMDQAKNKELKWHLASLSSRLILSTSECASVCRILSRWCLDRAESRIVRVNSLQALAELQTRWPENQSTLIKIMNEVAKEKIPSLQARINRVRRTLKEQSDE